jgi:methionyl-tRNA formyltransferase
VLLLPPALDGFQNAVLEAVRGPGRHELAGAVVDARPGKPLRERLRQNLRRGRGGYVLIMAAQLLRRRRMDQQAVPAPGWCRQHDIPVLEATEPYSPETAAWIARLQPDVLALLGGFGIVKQPLLSVAPLGVLSYHHGDMRRYRGMPPGLWELYHGEREMGVTVQRLSGALDAGEPILERAVAISLDDTVGLLRARALAESTDMLALALDRLADPGFEPEQIESYGPVYTLPNLRQWLVLQGRLAARRRVSSRGT